MNRRRFIISCGTLVASFTLPLPKLLTPVDGHKAHLAAHYAFMDDQTLKKLLKEYYMPGIVHHVNEQARYWKEVKKNHPKYFECLK